MPTRGRSRMYVELLKSDTKLIPTGGMSGLYLLFLIIHFPILKWYHLKMAILQNHSSHVPLNKGDTTFKNVATQNNRGHITTIVSTIRRYFGRTKFWVYIDLAQLKKNWDANLFWYGGRASQILQKSFILCVTAGFRREVDENCALLGPIFRGLDSRPPKMGPIGCPETSVRNCHYSLRNNPVQRSSWVLFCYKTL